MTISFNPAIPVFRIFSEEKAREFYLDFLGFTVDWEHCFEPDMPIYMQVSRGPVVLHLSEHHGDACPGSTAYVRMRGVREFHSEISAKGYRNLRPGVESPDWTDAEMTVTDPFGNRIRFGEIAGKKD
ncbi:glyoxalase superfamily protein [Pseudorhodoplanes sp.]|uniref:glyoxalase superfamily protein n=1 Tax=Pseudorhodoplanes sp. TaxID=1934341 RepID=UPI002B5DE7D2|nr:glyoxalase superfamily protein [Pseudorhodoplanes sp.]HWV53919.1 glyoxalase superfamily protein [Pseudorhodoplanes sp.]